MVFKDLYNLLDPAVLFEVRMKDIAFFKGTKNQFEKVKNKEYIGMDLLQIGSVSLEEEKSENFKLSIIKIELAKVPIFKLYQKESDR